MVSAVPYSTWGIRYIIPKKLAVSSWTMGTFALSLVMGMLIKLPASVPASMRMAVVGLKPTSLKANVITPRKIRPTATMRINSRIPKTR